MSPRLALHFLGTPEVHLDHEPINLERRKALALLAYLALEWGPHSRESLSALLWPEVSQTSAFKNLRQVLWAIQKAIGDDWLVSDHGRVSLNEGTGAAPGWREVWLDVRQFVSLFNTAREQNEVPLRIPLLTEAANLYRNHFLVGFSLKDAFPFNDWAFAVSEDLRHKLSSVLSSLSEDYCTIGQAARAIPHARQLVALDPLNEAAHRQLMEVYLQAGQQNTALRQYQDLEQTLRRELNIDPQPETRELYKKIRKGEMKPVVKKQQEAGASPGTAATVLPNGTVTFLFTDIEGSTRLANQFPDSMADLLTRHQEILNQSLQAHQGYIFQVVGDSVAAAFHSVSDALLGALDAQRSLQNEEWEPLPVKVRMAIHTGAAQLQDTTQALRYTGYTTLALAQRIMSMGHGGQVLLSQTAQDLARTHLPNGVQLRDLGEYHMKDFTQSERIYQLVVPGLASEFPPLRIQDAFPNNLPVQLSKFIGREKVRAEITDLIMENRLATLIGPGGIGKTRLSLESAREVLQAFPGGVWFIELASFSDPERVSQTVFTSLGLIEQAGRSHQEILTDFLRSKRAMLILDNCEHLIQACAQLVQHLLYSCTDLHILATSREALGVSGETLFLVPTLSTPDPLGATLVTLPDYEASQLFLERAQSALAGFQFSEENVFAIAEICHQLDGIPLAIELAAARVKLLTVEEIAARLDDRFRLLTGGARTALPRHQTLQALIDWSHDLLSEAERVLLRRLSIFAGGWTLEAAEKVTAETGQAAPDMSSDRHQEILSSSDVLDLLTSLVNKSLIMAERKPEEETRYDMLETIRQYTLEKLWRASEGKLLHERHLVYYVDLAERAEPNLRAPDMILWLDRLQDEHDNIRAAMEWAFENNIEAGLRLASALLWFWHIRGHKNEGIEWLERFLSIEAMDQEGQPFTPRRAMIRGKALNASGSLMVMNHEFDRAPVRLEECLALFKELGPSGKQGMAYAILRLALLPSGWRSASQAERARSMLEQSLLLFREIGDKFGVAETLMQLAGIAQSDDYQRAVLFVEEELALSREIGDQDGIAVALTNLGDLALSRDDYQKAITFYEEGLRTFRGVRNSGALSLALDGYGDVLFWQGDYERAAQIHEEALAFAEELGYRFLIAYNFYSLGIIAWFKGDYAQAKQKIMDSEPIFRAISHDWLALSSLHTLGNIALAEGDEAGAAGWFQDELALSRKARLNGPEIFALNGLGKVAWVRGDHDLAARQFEESLRMSRAEDIWQATFHSLYGMGRVAHSRGDYKKADSLFREALQLQKRRISPLFNWAWQKTYSTGVSYPLEGLGVLAASQNDMRRAARVIGAAEKLYTPLHFELSAAERREHEGAVESARAALGEEAFAAAFQEGREMTLEDVISYASKEK